MFTCLTAVAVVLAARVGVGLLVSALMIVPVAAGLHVARSCRSALLVIIGLGALSVVLGLYVSFVVDVASGAAIALASTAVFLVVAATRSVLRSK